MNELIHHFGIPHDVAHATALVGGVGLFVHALLCLTATFLDLLSQGDQP